MELQNLVFNKLGNSFSALLMYEDRTVQLWDDARTRYFEIKHVCSTDEIPFSVVLKIEEKSYNISFTKEGFAVKELTFQLDKEEGFYKIFEEPEYIFKLSMANTSILKIENVEGKVKVHIPEKDFFKGIFELLTFVE